MALKSGSLGTLLQGVSQQPPLVRIYGQVSDQINMVSDVTLGLSSRPTSSAGPVLYEGFSGGNFKDLTLDSEDYIVSFSDSGLRVWNTGGTELDVTDNSSGTYIGENMVLQVVDGEVVVVNRDTPVEIADTSTGIDWYSSLIHALGGQFSRTYQADVSFSDGTSVSVSYTTPDGTGDGDAADTSSEAIIKELYLQLLDSSTPSGTVVGRRFDVIRIYHPTLQITTEVSDGAGGEILRSVSENVQDSSDLPRFAANGTVVKVVTSEYDEDDYWLKFVAEGASFENGFDGFGSSGVWTEWHDPREIVEFNLDTMPHVLRRHETGFVLERGPWVSRQVGDESSSPFPSIVGHAIRDVGGFESRLVLLSKYSVVMSRTNEPFDLWRETATEVLATDPIDITSTKKDDLSLDWLVPFDRDLFIVADPGDSQFVIRGGGIEPNTASIVLTTEFTVGSKNARPVSTGRTILLPFVTGKYSGINEFYTNSENASNSANNITETQNRYILGEVRGLCVNQTANTVLLLAEGDARTVWVYKYLWDSNTPLQSSWSKWVFEDDVEHLFFRGSIAYIVGKDADNNVFLHTLDLDRPEGDFGFHLSLDRKATFENTTSGVVLQFDKARFQQNVGCASPGSEVEYETVTRLSSTEFMYTFDPEVVPDGAYVTAGQSVEWSVEPTRAFGRDFRDNVDTSQLITVQEYVVSINNSGEFVAVGKSPYGDDWDFNTNEYSLDDDPLDTERLLVRDGEVAIPWGERADLSTLTLTGSDIRPVTIHEVRWVGQVIKTAGRGI